MKYKIGFIGIGNMGGALLRAVCEKLGGEGIAVADMDESKTAAASAEFGIRGEPIAEDGALGLITISIQAAEDADVGEPRITRAHPGRPYTATATETGVQFTVPIDTDEPNGGMSLIVIGENLQKIADQPYYKVALFLENGEVYYIFDVTSEYFEYNAAGDYLKSDWFAGYGGTDALRFAVYNDGGETWTSMGVAATGADGKDGSSSLPTVISCISLAGTA